VAAGGSTKVILASLGANLSIAIAKGTAAFFTKSGAMLAEAIHSLADCTNQVFLLIGAKEAQRGPDESHLRSTLALTTRTTPPQSEIAC